MGERPRLEKRRENVVYTGSGLWFYFLFLLGQTRAQEEDEEYENDQNDTTGDKKTLRNLRGELRNRDEIKKKGAHDVKTG